MATLRFAPMLALSLLPAAPAYASVAEREPASGALWLAVIGVAGMSWVMACRRWWLPLVIWGPVALFASVFVAELCDPSIGAAIRDELGAGYIIQADLCSALLVAVPLMLANLRLTRHSGRDPD